MKLGLVIVDMAVGQGGNCECIKAGKDVQWNGVIIFGFLNLLVIMLVYVSELYVKNIFVLFKLMIKDGKLNFNFEDDIIVGVCVIYGGEICN